MKYLDNFLDIFFRRNLLDEIFNTFKKLSKKYLLKNIF